MKLMASKSMHVFPMDGGWGVRKLGSAKKTLRLYPTQKAAVEAAREIVRRQPAGQVVIHRTDGSMTIRDRHGIRPVQRSRLQSDLGRKAIEKAVSSVFRERLAGD